MKLMGGLVLTALLFALPARADEIVYSYVFNSIDSGDAGKFSWTVETDGFIQPVPYFTDGYHIYDSNDFCANCGDAHIFTPVESSAPANGCQPTAVNVEMAADFQIYTTFSCTGSGGCVSVCEETNGGRMPDVGQLGTFPWNWAGESFGTLTISDASAVPEPAELALLLCGLAFLWVGTKTSAERLLADLQRSIGR